MTRAPSRSEELNTLLMHATFLIVGPTNVPNQISFGTVFVMGLPYKDTPKIAHIENYGSVTSALSLHFIRTVGDGKPFPA